MDAPGVNYFEFWIGDYKRDTARLGLIEHGAYQQLMLAYYAEEEALPATYDELYQIAAAVTAADKAAVRKVADRFFPVAEDGLRHKNRIDEEIAKAQKRIAIAKANGQKNKPNKNPAGMPAGMPPAMPADTQRDTQSGEALHTPHATLSVELPTHTPASTTDPTAAGRACRLMRDAGCMRTNPSHAALVEAIAAGVTPEALGDTAREGVEQGKSDPFAWAISTCVRRMADAKRPVKAGAPRTQPASRHNSGTAGFLGATHEHHEPDSAVVLDVDRRGLGELVPAVPGRVSGG